MQLIVTVKKLNKRTNVPTNFTDNNIAGVVLQGYRFEGEEAINNNDQTLGKWYKDKNGYYYWGGGLLIEPTKVISNLGGLPLNLPSNYQLGIDIAHHDAKPDWAAIKNAGASFIFIKISEGVGTPDPMAKQHADNARSKGLKIGYYHFCRPDTRNGGTIESDATAEANDALSRMANLPKNDLPLVLDLENQENWDTPLNRNDYLVWIKTFLNRIKLQTGSDSILYSRKEYLDRKLPNNHGLGNYKLWLSYYPEKPDCKKSPVPIGWQDWAIWQYTETGVIGSSNKMDINILKDNDLI